ncbi:GtrA family protein [Legionella resiliens]|uniref:GtrA family protein n=1 Tax=Legionella resiliens TaxID=2905958 RepID=A0ABS8X359_9GAMM|nr:GtrA family protein [Legionella sp. 9fVS26]MCE3532166.1 GtrA family protein [Legionella sp. 8cVS16]
MFYYLKSKQFIAFIIAGAIAVTVNFCSRIIYSYSFSFSTSILLAYITGMVVSFILVKFFVFKTSQQTLTRSIIYFILINLIGMSQTLLVSLLFAHYFLPAMDIKSLEIAHAIGLASPAFTTYLGHKFLTFREKI